MFSGILEQSVVSTEQEQEKRPWLSQRSQLARAVGSLASYSKQWDSCCESLPLCFCQMIKVLSEKHCLASKGAQCVLKKLPGLHSASSPSTSSASSASGKAGNVTLSLSYEDCFLPLMTPPEIPGEAAFSSRDPGSWSFLPETVPVGLGLR